MRCAANRSAASEQREDQANSLACLPPLPPRHQQKKTATTSYSRLSHRRHRISPSAKILTWVWRHASGSISTHSSAIASWTNRPSRRASSAAVSGFPRTTLSRLIPRPPSRHGSLGGHPHSRLLRDLVSRPLPPKRLTVLRSSRTLLYSLRRFTASHLPDNCITLSSCGARLTCDGARPRHRGTRKPSSRGSVQRSRLIRRAMLRAGQPTRVARVWFRASDPRRYEATRRVTDNRPRVPRRHITSQPLTRFLT